MAATEVETPVKMCMLVLEKKVRNLEKRKGKLESYQEKLTSGEGLNKDQLEAIQKYDEVLQTLEFSRDLQKQFQTISIEVDKMQKKQSKKEKADRQQMEMLRLQELLHLQTLLDTLGDDAVRERLKSVPGDLVITDENLNQLDEFYQLIAPSREEIETEFTRHVASAAEHIQLYLDRSDKAVVSTNYLALHELINRLEASNLLQTAATITAVSKQIDQPSAEEQMVETEQQLTIVQQSELPVSTGQSEHSDISSLHSSTGGVNIPPHDSPVISFLSTGSVPVPDTPWASQSITTAAVHSSPVPVGSSGQAYENSFFGGIPSSSQLPVSHRIETSSYAQHASRQQRPIQDIVSSMQGSFHFLQESQIDLENQSLLSNVRNSNQTYAYSVASTMPTGNVGPYPARVADSPNALNHSSSPRHFTAAVSSLYHQPAAATFFGGQHRASPGLSFADQHQGSYLLSEGSHQLTSSADETCPMPIPLPNEVGHGQSLTMNAFNVAELSKSPVNKQFAMNPNANVFRSVYDPTTVSSQSSALASQFQQSTDSLAPAVEGGSTLQSESDFADSEGAFTTVGGYDSVNNGTRGSGNYARQDNGYSRGARGSVGQAYNGSRGGGGVGSGYNTQRGMKNSPRGSSVSAAGSMGNSAGQGAYSARGGATRGGRGFNQSSRVGQHMAA